MTSRNVDEYLVCVPKHNVKKYNVMRFNAGDNVDIRNWINGSLSRDMSAKKIYEDEEVFPEFGEGSEYGRKQREEARRLKYGIKKSKFNESDQPWDLSVTTLDTQSEMKKKVNGKSDTKPKFITREYCGKKEGGIGEGSMYFVFTQRPDFTFEAHSVEDWFNFRRKIQHRTLTDEEAEAAWDKRDKIVNHLNYMARKRLHINEEGEEGPEVGSSKTPNKGIKQEKSSDLMIHDNEDYDLYMSGSSSEDESDGDDKSKKKKKAKKTKKPTEDSEEKTEVAEDSDDGDDEGNEIAYASDVSSENEEIIDAKVAPRGLDELSSSSSSEDEEESKKNLDANLLDKQDKTKDSDNSSDSGDSNSDIDEDDSISKSALFMQRKKTSPKEKKSSSRSSTPTTESGARSKILDSKKQSDKDRRSPFNPAHSLLGKRHKGGADKVPSKQAKLSSSRTNTPTKELLQQGITEEAVRRYLTFKPMTTKDLLKKFKTKKTGLTSQQTVEKVSNILKKLNPEQSKLNGRMHLYLKAT